MKANGVEFPDSPKVSILHVKVECVSCINNWLINAFLFLCPLCAFNLRTPVHLVVVPYLQLHPKVDLQQVPFWKRTKIWPEVFIDDII